MLKAIQNRFALSKKGASDFLKGVLFTVILDIALMLPAVFLIIFLNDYLNLVFDGSALIGKGAGYYIGVGIIFIVIMYMIAIFQYKSTYTVIYDESANRRISLAEKLRRLPLAFFGEKNLSDLTSTIMEDSTDLEHTFSHAVPQLFASIIAITMIGVGLFIANWQLALALFWVVPIAAMIIFFSKKKQYDEFASGYQSKRDVSEMIQEGLETIQEIKSYNQEDAYQSSLNNLLNKYESKQIKGELMVGVLVHFSQAILKLGLVSVIVTGAQMMAAGSIELMTYLIFLVVASRIYAPINEVFNNLAALFYLDVRINRMNDMQGLPVQNGDKTFEPKDFTIVFEDVSFSYQEGKTVIDQVSFTAKQGETTALVGPSGGGKSTIAKLAARFWDIDTGKITLGGQDISKINPETLLQYYSIVFQDVVLFNTTVMDNIRIGKKNATDEEVLQAARLAQCDDFVNKMPEGYDSIIGENGETLSGGERQRISIARALLKDSPIIILDEATASLDVGNETKIQKALSELVKNKTVLIIAHRMRTVAKADHIVVLDEGKLIEQGNHEQLLNYQGVYAKMWNIQQKAATWSL